METRQFSPEPPEGSSAGEATGTEGQPSRPESADQQADESSHPHGKRRRRKIKIRKRIRIRKKPSPKKKIRKILETTAWVVIVAGFIITLIVMVKELELKDMRVKANQQYMKKQNAGKK